LQIPNSKPADCKSAGTGDYIITFTLPKDRETINAIKEAFMKNPMLFLCCQYGFFEKNTNTPKVVTKYCLFL